MSCLVAELKSKCEELGIELTSIPIAGKQTPACRRFLFLFLFCVEAVLAAVPRGLRGAARPGLVRLVLSPSVQLIFSKKPGV